MTWIVNNWSLILILLLVIVGLVKLIVENDKVKAKEWLLMAVFEAEKMYGGKTGQIKLRYVFDMFIEKYPLLSKFISFEQFSEMVDDALVGMKHLIETNMALFKYVNEEVV